MGSTPVVCSPYVNTARKVADRLHTTIPTYSFSKSCVASDLFKMTVNVFGQIYLAVLEAFMLLTDLFRVNLFPNMFRALAANFGPRKFFKEKDVTNKIVLITGGANGLGRLIALRFAHLKAKLVLWDIDEKGLEQTAADCRELGAQVHYYRVDMSERKEIYAIADKVKSEVGHVDILINNAGIARGGAFLEKDDDFIEKTVQINTIAHFWTVKAFLPHMIETDSGHIVCIASLAGLWGAKSLAEYSASKFGAAGFQEAIENEVAALGKRHVEFTTVCPSFITTNMLNGIPLPKAAETMEPDFVADHIMEAILTNQRLLILPKKAHLFYAAKGLFPRRSLQQFMLRQHK